MWTIQRSLGDPMETPDLSMLDRSWSCWRVRISSISLPSAAASWKKSRQWAWWGQLIVEIHVFQGAECCANNMIQWWKSNIINMFQWFGWFWMILDDFGWFWNLDHSGSGFGLTASPRSTAWGKWWRLVPAWDGSPCFRIAEMATCDSTGNRMFSISFF